MRTDRQTDIAGCEASTYNCKSAKPDRYRRDGCTEATAPTETMPMATAPEAPTSAPFARHIAAERQLKPKGSKREIGSPPT